MTLPDVGVLQSAALIGYLFGQVNLFSLVDTIFAAQCKSGHA